MCSPSLITKRPLTITCSMPAAIAVRIVEGRLVGDRRGDRTPRGRPAPPRGSRRGRSGRGGGPAGRSSCAPPRRARARARRARSGRARAGRCRSCAGAACPRAISPVGGERRAVGADHHVRMRERAAQVGLVELEEDHRRHCRRRRAAARRPRRAGRGPAPPRSRRCGGPRRPGASGTQATMMSSQPIRRSRLWPPPALSSARMRSRARRVARGA